MAHRGSTFTYNPTVVAATTINDAGSVKEVENLPQQLFFNDAGSVKEVGNVVVFLPYE